MYTVKYSFLPYIEVYEIIKNILLIFSETESLEILLDIDYLLITCFYERLPKICFHTT